MSEHCGAYSNPEPDKPASSSSRRRKRTPVKLVPSCLHRPHLACEHSRSFGAGESPRAANQSARKRFAGCASGADTLQPKSLSNGHPTPTSGLFISWWGGSWFQVSQELKVRVVGIMERTTPISRALAWTRKRCPSATF
ncbi:hypothetical protein U1Q18_012482 [Sarracenia purpurea var. burkii]